jgi:hypothetical protein
VEIVAFAAEDRMHVDADREEQVARVAASPAGVSLARNPDARAVVKARRHVDGEGLESHLDLLTRAARTASLRVTGAAAVRTRPREHHVPPRRSQAAASLAHDAGSLRRLHYAGAAARPAGHLAGDRHRTLSATHRLFERAGQLLMQIGSAFRPPGPFLAGAEDVGKQLAERGRRRSARVHREIETLEPGTRRIDVYGHRPMGVVTRSPGRVAQRLIGLRDAPELGCRQAIARIDIRMVPPGKTAVRPLDVTQRGVTSHAEDQVQIHVRPRAMQIEG